MVSELPGVIGPSLAKALLKVVIVGRNRSLVAHTNKCGWAISVQRGSHK